MAKPDFSEILGKMKSGAGELADKVKTGTTEAVGKVKETAEGIAKAAQEKITEKADAKVR